MLNSSQIATLKTLVMNEGSLASAVANADDQAVADWLNADSGTKGWVTEFTTAQLLDALNWTAFIGRSVGERDALQFMFREGFVNTGRTNIQQGFSDIFSGITTAAVNQREALVAAAQRPVSRAEKALADSLVNGAYVLVFEGEVSPGEASTITRG